MYICKLLWSLLRNGISCSCSILKIFQTCDGWNNNTEIIIIWHPSPPLLHLIAPVNKSWAGRQWNKELHKPCLLKKSLFFFSLWFSPFHISAISLRPFQTVSNTQIEKEIWFFKMSINVLLLKNCINKLLKKPTPM